MKKILVFIFMLLSLSFLQSENFLKQILNKGDKLIVKSLLSAKNIIKNEDLMKGNYTLVISISDGCLSCNKNLAIWNKLSRLQGLKTIGLAKNVESCDRLSQTRLIKFDIYYPIDIKSFEESNFQLNEAVDYTFLLKGNKVIYFRIGRIEINDYFYFKKIIRGDK